MTWPKVLIFAVITAVVTAVFLLIPVFNNTSFQDLGTYLDCWFVFAIFIVMNCKKWQEASIKVFVFFLVSQPLIYLIQVPFSSLGWQIFMYYKVWFIMTVLTLPGAAIAFLIKKQNGLSVAVLSVANVYFILAGVSYIQRTIKSFPHHLLSAICCFTFAIMLTLIILPKKKHRIAAFIVMGVFLVIAAIGAYFGMQLIE